MPQTRRGDTSPPRTGLSEKDVLVGFLDYLRVCVIGKVQDVSEPLVRTPRVPSGTNLLGLLKHLTYVEQYTFLGERSLTGHRHFTLARRVPRHSRRCLSGRDCTGE